MLPWGACRTSRDTSDGTIHEGGYGMDVVFVVLGDGAPGMVCNEISMIEKLHVIIID